MTSGRQPQLGLEPRICTICGSSYQPYRASAKACSKRCYRQLTETRSREAAYKARPEIKAHRNELRRVGVNPARREVNLRGNLRQYGITVEDYRGMVARQEGRCAICGELPKGDGHGASSRLHVDHDHRAHRNRGLLCGRCNQGIGYFNEDPALFQAAVDYLGKYL